MPTGYTAPVQSGEITELADFVISCARAFGALVLLRDSEQGLDATRRYIEEGAYLNTSSYYPDALEAAQVRLSELLTMSGDEVLAAAQAEADRVEARNREMEEKRVVELARYEAMIEKVEAWQPPSEEHERFKEYMLSQLRESVQYDCRPFSMPVPDVSLDWRDAEIAREERNIERYKLEIAKERERNEARRAWVEALLGSLE